jgi:hypothetical protein
LEKAPKGLDEDTVASLQALRERVTSLEERPVPRAEAGAGLDEAAEGRISRLENGILTISQNLQEGGGRIGALEDSIGQLGERLQATRQELLSSITAMAARVERLEAGPLHPPGFPPPWQPNLQLPMPPEPLMPSARVVQQAPVSQPAPSRLQQRLLRRIAKHPKDVVKSAILTLIQKYGRLAGTELREMVVEEQQLCSKSSFYRLLEELEKDRLISIVGDGKEKTLLPTEHKHRRIEER